MITKVSMVVTPEGGRTHGGAGHVPFLDLGLVYIDVSLTITL